MVVIGKNKILIICLRVLLMPFGFFIGLFRMANAETRNIVNKLRYSKSIIHSGCNITNDTIIGKRSSLNGISYYNNSKIGDYTYVSRNCIVQNAIIGNYCSIAHNVMIGLGEHPTDMFSTSPIFYTNDNEMGIKILKENRDFIKHGRIVIGNDVWIGANAIILNGIAVGDGAIIAAGAVVTKDVRAYSVVAGVPARVIKYRETGDFSKAIEEEWWNLNPQEVNKLYNIK